MGAGNLRCALGIICKGGQRKVCYDFSTCCMQRPIKFLTVLMLVLTVGLHWALLQTVAWTGMLVSYSRDGSFTEAVSKTFDGAHPCCLCKAIKSGRQAEQKQSKEQLPSDAKIKCVLPVALVCFYDPATTEAPLTIVVLAPPSHQTEPQTPPPRAVCVV